MSEALFRATNFSSFRDGHQDFGENGRAMSRRRCIAAGAAALITASASPRWSPAAEALGAKLPGALPEGTRTEAVLYPGWEIPFGDAVVHLARDCRQRSDH